jgi:CoA:oxalate CoA-transferase
VAERRPQTPRPLAGIKILDFTRWLAGPYATSILGDMGADVIKVERGSGDGTRQVDRLFAPGMSSYFLGLNRSKRSVWIDYETPAGRRLLKKLVKKVDIVIENFRPGVMDRLGLDYSNLLPINPQLIFCSVSSFGSKGPLREKPGMDLVVQAMGGVMALTGDPAGPPMRAGAPIADFVGAYQTVTGVLLALVARERAGVGQRVDVALIDGQVSMLSNYVPGFFLTGKPDRPIGGGHPQLAPYQLFATKDGYLVVACLTEEFWRRLCVELDLPGLIEDDRFRRNADRVEHRDELIAILAPAVLACTSGELSARLDARDVPNAPVFGLADLIEHPQLRENQMFLELDHPDVGTYHVTGVPVKLSGTPGEVSRPAPRLGEHTREVLHEFGLSSAEIATWTEKGALALEEEQPETVRP